MTIMLFSLMFNHEQDSRQKKTQQKVESGKLLAATRSLIFM